MRSLLPSRLLWRLYATYLVLILTCAGVILGYLSRSVRALHVETVGTDLVARAHLVELSLEERATALELQELALLVGDGADTRLTVIDTDGRVLADSESDPATMENHAGRPEIREALAGRTGTSLRHSRTLGRTMVYAAVPRLRDGRVTGVVRAAIPLTELDETLARLYRTVAAATGGVAILAAGLGWLISWRMRRQLDTMRQAAERFAAGELGYHLPTGAGAELDALGDALNRMAAQLDDKLQTISAQASEREAVLSSMAEGVLAVDHEARVVNVNGAAARLLGTDADTARGRSLPEVVRDAELERIVNVVLETGRPAEGAIVLRQGEERHLQVHGSVLHRAVPGRSGAVLVLNDVTRLRRLETVRREFVANVSHELKTPVTSIKGFVETLREDELTDPERVRHFLDIVFRQSERLSSIIEDLLTLSRLEQEGEGSQPPLHPGRVRTVLASAMQACELKADEKSIELELDCDEELRAHLNAALLEQAVVNLVENAVKYSEKDSTVTVSARHEDGDVMISVHDDGPGIEPEHLPRLFERFYRVDKARSRQAGGTGLGLAIVKHVAQVHGGAVGVDSRPGEGSTFHVRLRGA